MHLNCVRAYHCTSWYRLFADSYRPGPVGLQYSPREVCTSVARGTLTPRHHCTRIQIAQYPTALMTFDDIYNSHGATNFHKALSEFLVLSVNPQAPQPEPQGAASHFNFSFSQIPVFQKVKIWTKEPQGHSEADDKLNVVHTQCPSKARSGCKLSVRFDTILVNKPLGGEPDEHGSLQGKPCTLSKVWV